MGSERERLFERIDRKLGPSVSQRTYAEVFCLQGILEVGHDGGRKLGNWGSDLLGHRLRSERLFFSGSYGGHTSKLNSADESDGQ